MRVPGVFTDAKTTPNVALSFVRDTVSQKLYKAPRLKTIDFSVPDNYEEITGHGRNSAHLVDYFPTAEHYKKYLKPFCYEVP